MLNEPEITLNEVDVVDRLRWIRMMNHLAVAIRKVAPKHTLIAAGFSTPDALIGMRTLKDSNVIYDFHFYLPGIFTHQGATWAVDYYRFLKRIPYPLAPGDEESILAQVPDEAGRKEYRDTYGSSAWPNSIKKTSWNASRIEQKIAQVAAWSKGLHVPVICEEFGVYPKFADPDARVAWITDVRRSLEKQGIGWAIWDYNEVFAIVSRSPAGPKPDPAIVRALGLRN